MQKYFLILAVLLISTNFTGCAHTSPGMKILEERANYQEMKNVQISDKKYSARSGSQVKMAWLYPHEMPTGDYFGGAWLHLVVKEDRWNVKELIR